MSVRILFIGVVIFLVAFALPVSACDVESSKQNASVDTLRGSAGIRVKFAKEKLTF